ncbi:hypothetical protein [Bradyrhizobium sp. Cp5.3]|uniref:hypothetical protein n=1 Tax=Bradyrhizobium sp. Cp5.3 TaxID=443598 RepID=UPI001FD9EC7E|nr:hypothetical protein [Bradyrhizobium sp. Cp5.3]
MRVTDSSDVRRLQIRLVDERGILQAESLSMKESKAVSPLEAITRGLQSQALDMQLEIAGLRDILDV